MKKASAALLIGAILIGGASQASAKTSTSPSPAATKNPYGSGFAVSNPADSEIVLTIKGSTTKNFTMGQLKKMATKSITVKEPFIKKTQTFKVILLKTLFAGVKVPAKANLNTIALNDYAFKGPASKFFGYSAYLAVFRDGVVIPMDAGGPIRLVFDSSSPWFSNLDAWNWSLRTIEVV